jgi:hypothetical protein
MRRYSSVGMTKAVTLFALVLFAGAMLCAASAQQFAGPRPLYPVRATFSYWDHHWFMWLPRDPIFEAAEIHANDAGPGGTPLVWVYFTQRAQPKTQTNYANNAAFAEARHWMYRDIAYAATGSPGEPYSVSASFTDDRGRAVSIKVAFAAGSKLSTYGAGVTDQLGHGADSAFLLLYRDATATPQSSSVTIDGTDVSAPVPGVPDPLPFHTAYSPKTINAAILFGDSHAGFSESGRPDPAHRLFVTNQNGITTELMTDDAQRTETYRLRSSTHLLTIAFTPALPAFGTTADQVSSFSIAVDDLGGLEGGTVSVHATARETVLDWHPDMPAWTRAYPFRTAVQLDPSGTFAMSAHTLRPSAPN